MDGARFDHLARAVARGTTRRGLLKGALGGLAAGVVELAGRGNAAAQRGQPNGAACTRATQCASFKCVDGVCCDTHCTGQCESCETGTCSPVSGAPVGSRPACPGIGVCQAACDGLTRTSCAAYPGAEVACADATCDHSWQTTYSCGGNGTCHPTVSSCEPYACDAAGAACLTTCADDDQGCVPHYHCDAGQCLPDEGLGAPCDEDSDCISGICNPVSQHCCSETCEAGLGCDGDGFTCDCIPDCTGKDCGDDGCGGSCGTCDAGQCLTCGAGQTCVLTCTENQTCVEGNCQEPCQAPGGACDEPADCCADGVCVSETCCPASQACSAGGIPTCCPDGERCNINVFCSPCGAQDQVCCLNGACDGDLECGAFSTCVPACGGAGEQCCRLDVCDGDLDCSPAAICGADVCGSEGQSCCWLHQCDAPLGCRIDDICVTACGGEGETCCSGFTCDHDGLRCSAIDQTCHPL